MDPSKQDENENDKPTKDKAPGISDAAALELENRIRNLESENDQLEKLLKISSILSGCLIGYVLYKFYGNASSAAAATPTSISP